MSFLSKIFSAGIKETIDGVAEIADKFITTPDEKKNFLIELQRIQAEKEQFAVNAAKEEMEAYLKDIQDARGTNVSIQQAEKASFLSKNIGYIIDMIVTILWSIITVYIILRVLNILESEKQPDMSVVLGIYAAITAAFTTVLNFHRGTSAGSANKDKTITKLAEK